MAGKIFYRGATEGAGGGEEAAAVSAQKKNHAIMPGRGVHERGNDTDQL
jgi:hypothetical protein